LRERAAMVAQGAMVVVRASDRGGSRGFHGCEGATLVARGTAVVALGSGVVVVARERD